MIPKSSVRPLEDFRLHFQIGKGTYGRVFKATDSVTGELVALKQILVKTENEGFPVTAVREIKILKQLDHPNVVRLLDVVFDDRASVGSNRSTLIKKSRKRKADDLVGKISIRALLQDSIAPLTDPAVTALPIFLALEYCKTDLAAYARSRRIPVPEIRSIFKSIMKAVAYCHENGVIHRDIKLSNVLLSPLGEVKVADFGLARNLSNVCHPKLTNRVITRWYRPPELLFGSVFYSTAIDIWSCGCVLAELLSGSPLFPGDTEIETLLFIIDLFGLPESSDFADCPEFSNVMRSLPIHRLYGQPGNFDKKFGGLDGFRLVKDMLRMVPSKRLPAVEVLKHAWLCEMGSCGTSDPTTPVKAAKDARVSVVLR